MSLPQTFELHEPQPIASRPSLAARSPVSPAVLTLLVLLLTTSSACMKMSCRDGSAFPKKSPSASTVWQRSGWCFYWTLLLANAIRDLAVDALLPGQSRKTAT